MNESIEKFSALKRISIKEKNTIDTERIFL